MGYISAWSQLFEEEALHIREVLSDNCTASPHVRSTAISGLDAKSILDILPVVRQIETVDPLKKAMEEFE